VSNDLHKKTISPRFHAYHDVQLLILFPQPPLLVHGFEHAATPFGE